MKKMNFEKITLRKKITSRGGGIEISLDNFGYPGEKMSAYQNYLGVGMLGKVCVNDTIRARHKFVELSIANELNQIGENLKKHFHELTNPEGWESQTFEQNQNMPESAY